MTWVLLAPPPDKVYYRMAEGGSKKHFELEDLGYTEVDSGWWYDMIELMRSLEAEQHPDGDIELYCQDTFSLILTTEECLNQMLENDPDYLNNKKFL